MSGKSIMTNPIIIEIRCVYFSEDEIGESHARLRARSDARSNNHRSFDHDVIYIF